jgi:hypothetical protein
VGTGIVFHQARARGVDAARRVVRTSKGDVRYDRLVFALGSRVRICGVPGVAEHALTLDGPNLARLRSMLPMLPDGAPVVVIGGGLSHRTPTPGRYIPVAGPRHPRARPLHHRYTTVARPPHLHLVQSHSNV